MPTLDIDGVGKVKVDDSEWNDLDSSGKQELVNRIAREGTTSEPQATDDSFITNLARSALGQGLLLGFGDEAEAGVRSLLSDETYDDALKDVRGELKGFRQENPGTALAAELGGGLVTGGLGGLRAASSALGRKVLEKAGTAGLGASIGATEGAIAGFGTGEGGLGNRLFSSGVGATIGGTIGGAVPGVVSVGKDVLSKATLPFRGTQAIEDAAGRKVVQAIEKSGKSVEDVQKGLDEGIVANQMIADVGTGTQRLGRGSAAVSGEGQDIAAKALDERQLALGDEIADDINKVFGVNQSSADVIDDIVDRQKINAADDYKKAFFETPDEVPFMRDPDGSGLTTRDLPTMERSAGVDEFKDFFKLPIFKQAYNKAKTLASLQGEKLPTLKNLLKDEKTSDVITVKQLHYIKMGLDEFIDVGKRQGSLGKQTQRELLQKRQSFIDQVDDVSNGFYKKANAKFAGDMRLREAVELGGDFTKSTPDQIERIVKKLSPSEKQGYLVGVADSIRNQADSAKDMANVADRLFGTPKKRKQLEALFPSKAAYSQFEKRMKARINQVKTRTAVNVGSRTAPLGEDIADVKGGLGMFLTGIPNVRDIAGTAVGLAKGTPDAVSSRISRDLFETDAIKQRETLARLARLRDEMIKSRNRSGNITGLFSGGSGALLGGSAGRNINDG